MSKRHYVIGGGSGFIGSALTNALRRRGDRVTWISRTAGPERITWADLARSGLPNCDGVVNLAGMHILNTARRWNAAYRAEVISSRTETTRILVSAINAADRHPEVFVSTAGKCFYGTQELATANQPPELDEDSPPQGMDFPAELVALWEQAAEGVDTARVRHVRLRIGVVLGAVDRSSHLGKLWRIGRFRGFLPIIRLPFCLGMGAVIGTGRQMFPWVHIADMTGVLLHTLDRTDTNGRYNAVSPGIVTNRDFILAFAHQLGRPVVWSVPEWLVRRLVGEERSSILLRGQLVRPKRTLESGYIFRFPTIEEAMAAENDLAPHETGGARDRRPPPEATPAGAIEGCIARRRRCVRFPIHRWRSTCSVTNFIHTSWEMGDGQCGLHGDGDRDRPR